MEMRHADEFPDVQALLERSHVRPRANWFGYALGIFLLVVLTSAYVTSRSPQYERIVDVASKLIMLTLMGLMAGLMGWTIRRHRQEMKRLEALEELVQLRRWPEALRLASEMLSHPLRAPQVRAQALLLFTSILARYQRFEDAINIHNHLLETMRFDDQTAHGIRLGRAMAMLREDHLVDAVRAISELRRSSPGESAGLELLELYRDVKTGHPTEAIERFDKVLTLFRQQLGHRTGDAYGLIAKAHDMLARHDQAQRACEHATLLTPAIELNRRYPELASLAQKYRAVAVPAELAMAQPPAREAA
jgi:tetratricopeptide (TPR) repeat protein